MPGPIPFAASGVGSHWWEGAVVARDALSRAGYDVALNTNTSNTSNILSVAKGESLLGITTPQFVEWSQRKIGFYADKNVPELRVVAVLNLPLWIAAAVDRSTGFKTLRELGAAKYPWKLIWPGNDNIVGAYIERIMHEHDFSIADIVAWGGADLRPMGPRPPGTADPENNILIRRNTAKLARSGESDGFFLYVNGHSPWARDMTALRDLRFLRFDETVIDAVTADWGGSKLTLPARLFNGLDEDMPVAGWRHHYIYGKPDVPDDLVHALLTELEDERTLENGGGISFAAVRPHLERAVSLHRAADAYYRARERATSASVR